MWLLRERWKIPVFPRQQLKYLSDGEEELTAAEGNGPVNALDHALRKALTKFYPQIKEMHLVDFKVRTLEGSEGTAAGVRVLLDSTDGKNSGAPSAFPKILLKPVAGPYDSIEYKLSKDKKKR